MKPKRILFVFVIALAAVVLSGCSGRGLNNSWPGLASDGEYAYLAAGQYVHAIRLSDGREVWRYPEKSSNSLQFIAQPVIAPDGTIVIGSAGSDHRLVALDPSNLSGTEMKTPAEKWIFSEAESTWVAGALILDDKVFAPNSDGTLYVLDLQDGFSTKSALKEIDLGGALWAQPSTDGELVYVSSVDHHLHAIDLETYEFAWPAIDLGGAAPGTPLVGPDGSLYIGSFASEVVKVDPSNGSSKLFANTEDWVWSAPVLDGETIYFGDLKGNLYAVDTASGKSHWQEPRNPDKAIVGSPLVTTDLIIITTESGGVYAYDRDGSKKWEDSEVGGQIYTAPVFGSDLILVAPMQADFLLAAYHTNGDRAWTYKLEN
jgi:outer membrane protein assembly factor BamB